MYLLYELGKAIEQLEEFYTHTDLSEFLNADYYDLYKFHFSIGLTIRNYLLKEDSVLYSLLKSAGIIQRDDMSSLILQLFYISLKSKDKSKLF